MDSLAYLETFVTYMRTQNVTKTAVALKISQPAVTAHIQKLENELGEVLFVPSGRTKVATPFAQELLAGIGEPMSQLRRAVELMKQKRSDPKSLHLRIACRAEIMPQIVGRLSFPGRVTWVSQGSDQAIASLRQGDVDIIIAARRPDMSDVIAKRAISEGGILVVPRVWLARKALAKSGSDPIELVRKLSGEPWVIYRNDAPLAGPVLKAAGINPENVSRIECEDWRSILCLVSAAKGISVIPSGLWLEDDAAYTPTVAHFPIPQKILPHLGMWASCRKQLCRHSTMREAFQSLCLGAGG